MATTQYGIFWQVFAALHFHEGTAIAVAQAAGIVKVNPHRKDAEPDNTALYPKAVASETLCTEFTFQPDNKVVHVLYRLKTDHVTAQQGFGEPAPVGNGLKHLARWERLMQKKAHWIGQTASRR